MIPSILAFRTESRWVRHPFLGTYGYEWRAVLETSAGVSLVGEWRGFESEAILDLPALKRAIAEPLAA